MSEISTQERPARRRWYTHPLVNLLAAIVVIALVQSFFVKVYTVPSGSMENTLQGGGFFGDRILVDRTAYGFGDEPRTGQVVVFTRTLDWDPNLDTSSSNPVMNVIKYFGDLTSIGPSHEQFLVKRVIGTGGQTVGVDDDGRVEIDGTPLDESYVFEDFPFEKGTLDCSTTPASLRCFDDYTVPDGKLLVLGDHRSNSSDSLGSCRGLAGPIDGCVRLVDIDDVVGRTFFVAWPLTRWQVVDNSDPRRPE